MIMRENFTEARKLLVTARQKDPKSLDIQRTAVLLLRADPSQGPDKALLLLDRIVNDENFGDRGELRLDRADCLIALNAQKPDEEKLMNELATLAEVPADWTQPNKVAFWNGLAGRYLAIGKRDETKATLPRVADIRPTELPTRLALFSMALEDNDDVAMRAAQDEILKVGGRKEDSNWLYCEARRLLSQVRRGQLDKASLVEIRRLTDRATKDRPNWFELHLVSAELDLLDGKEEDALVHFDKAQELGRPNAMAVLQHVRLLLNKANFKRAQELIEQLPVGVREGDLGNVYAEVLMNTGDVETAVQVIKKYADAAPDNAERRHALGQMLSRAAVNPDFSEQQREKLVDQAGEALQA